MTTKTLAITSQRPKTFTAGLIRESSGGGGGITSSVEGPGETWIGGGGAGGVLMISTWEKETGEVGLSPTPSISRWASSRASCQDFLSGRAIWMIFSLNYNWVNDKNCPVIK
jgi:hypothetical protein